MHPIFILSIVLQIACGVHALRTGRPMYWLFLLFIGSYVAVAIYLLVEVLPELRHNRGARRALRGVQDQIDPERHRREAERLLETADTRENRERLAEESLERGDFARAETLYRSALSGLYANDPNLMLGLARALFGLERSGEARQTLEALIAANPNFRSPEGHLLYARCVEADGDLDAALHEYEAVAQGYPGEEARVRYARALRHAGRVDDAAAVLRESLRRAELAPAYYRRDQRIWLDEARRALDAAQQ